MAKQETVKVSPAELKRAKDFWANFTENTKWSVIAIVSVLALMALFLL